MIFTRDYLKRVMGVEELRNVVRDLGGTPSNLNKDALIELILKIQGGEVIPEKSNRGRKSRLQKAHEQYERQDEPFERQDEQFQKDNFEEVCVRENPSYEPIQNDLSVIKGVIEIHEQGYGFLRGENYEADKSTDIYVSQNTINYFKLRRGDYIEGTAEKAKNMQTPSLKTIIKLNGRSLSNAKRPYFDDLTPCYPDEKIKMERCSAENDLSIRAIDLFCPIGKGQRGLIVAPPKAGKTTLIKKIAKSIEENHKEIKLLILLIDERPEEVTDLKRFVNGEVIYSTFDESPEHHVRLAELLLNRAKRLVEMGDDVVILLDSITKLTRAYNSIIPSSGKTLSGGIDPIALQAPKKFFGSARNIENGGSLTILSTALIDTGSKMDDVIYEEFKGTGNMEIILSRELSERRIFPAIDLYRSGTRKDELLLSTEELDAVYAVRKFLDRREDASQNLLDMLKRTKNNKEFTAKVPEWCKMLMD